MNLSNQTIFWILIALFVTLLAAVINYLIAVSRENAARQKVQKLEAQIEEERRAKSSRVANPDHPWEKYPFGSDEAIRALQDSVIKNMIDNNYPKAHIENQKRDNQIFWNKIGKPIGPAYMYNDTYTKITYQIADPSKLDFVHKSIHSLLENDRDVNLLEYQETLGIKITDDLRLPLPKPPEPPPTERKVVKGFSG